MNKNKGLDLSKEILEQSVEDYVFGASSPKCIATIPMSERSSYLPRGENQYGKEDYFDCVTREVHNILETKLTFLYRNGLLKEENSLWLRLNGYVTLYPDGEYIELSDRYTAIKSGTTRAGNSMKAPAHSVHANGVIPKSLFPSGDFTWVEYHNPKNITSKMNALAAEFAKRFAVNYEQVPTASMEEALLKDMVGVAVSAWGAVTKDGYQKHDGFFNHAVMAFELPLTYVFDNYEETLTDSRSWVKKLAPDFNFFEYGYRIYIRAEYTEAEYRELLSLRDKLALQVGSLIAQIVEFITGTAKSVFAQPAYENGPESLPVNKEEVKKKMRTILLETAYKHIGTDASPRNLAPSELSCAEAVSNIIHLCIPEFPHNIISTAKLDATLRNSDAFKSTLDLAPGNILVSPTGKGNNPAMPNGHAGIILENGIIASNDSRDGKWRENYTIDEWIDRYRRKGGYPLYVFEAL